MKNAISYEKLRMQRLKDPEYARGYLEVEIEEYYKDGNTEALLKALKDVAIAQKGIANIASEIKMSRQSLYKALSPKGNPTLDTLLSLLNSLGLKLAFEHVTIQVENKI